MSPCSTSRFKAPQAGPHHLLSFVVIMLTVIKDLKVKGSSSVVKVGTQVKNIRLLDGDHDIDCRVDGIGPMKLKSEFVRKA